MRKLLMIAGLGLVSILCVSAKPLVVVTTTTLITDMVTAVGGDAIQVVPLMGPGTDPHLYKPTAQDARKLRLSDVIFYNGLHLEGRLEGLLIGMRKHGKDVHAVTENLPKDHLLAADDNHPDPHVWFDAALWAECIDTVAQTLASNDPQHAAAFAERAAALKESYLGLHQWVLQTMHTLPVERRVLITSHDAYRYFGRAYGLEVIGVQGISTTTEAGLADITRVVDYIRQHHIPAIFVESSVSPATIERISKDAGVQLGGELYSDALGSPQEHFTDPDTNVIYALSTYEGVMRYNVTQIVRGLSE